MFKQLRPVQLALLSLLVALPAAAQAPNATAGPLTIISPWNFWSSPLMGRFYNSSALAIGGQGGSFFLYVQGGVYNSANGGPGSDCAYSNEEILIFETQYTHDNIRSAAYGAPQYCASGCPHPAQGPWTFKGHANPCVQPPPGVTRHHYNLGSVFFSTWDSQYKMLVDETDNTANWGPDWARTLLLTSTDGINWVSQPHLLNQNSFLHQSIIGGQTIPIGQVSLVQGASEWWGTFSFGVTCDCSLGRIRVFQSSTNQRGFIAYIWSSDSQWHAVNDDGTFNYMPMDVNPSPLTLSKVKLVNQNGQYEAWGNIDTDNFTEKQALDPKDNGCPDSPGNLSQSEMLMATINEGTADTTTAPPALGTPVYITSSLDTNSDNSQNWPLATLGSYRRAYPYRFNDFLGKYIVFSSSLDHSCWQNLLSYGNWRGMEVLLTVVDR